MDGFYTVCRHLVTMHVHVDFHVKGSIKSIFGMMHVFSLFDPVQLSSDDFFHLKTYDANPK